MATKRKIQIKGRKLIKNIKKTQKKTRRNEKRRTRRSNKPSRKTRHSKKYFGVGGGEWIDSETLPEEDICPICHEEFSKTPEQAVYKTDCGHVFHNNCLNRLCETSEKNSITPKCPLCREDLYNEKSDQCTDVWAFANKALDTNDLDSKNKAIYEAQPDERVDEN